MYTIICTSTHYEISETANQWFMADGSGRVFTRKNLRFADQGLAESALNQIREAIPYEGLDFEIVNVYDKSKPINEHGSLTAYSSAEVDVQEESGRVVFYKATGTVLAALVWLQMNESHPMIKQCKNGRIDVLCDDRHQFQLKIDVRGRVEWFEFYQFWN